MDIAILAFLPILIAAVLMVGLRLSAKIVMPIVFITTVAIAVGGWQLSMAHLFASIIQGIVVTLDILYIIFGAILLLNLLKFSGGIDVIRGSFSKISEDRRVQVIIIVWLFGSFLEGAAGFGTPAAIVAPLLLALGFPTATAVMLGMMVQSTAVTFGALGTPILIGVASGLQSAEFNSHLLDHGIGAPHYLHVVGAQAAIVHALVGTLMPTLMIAMMTRFFGVRKSWKEGLTIWRFSLFAGLCFTIPYVLTAIYLGPEFPSLMGSLVGLPTVMYAAKKGFLLPDTKWDFPVRASWPEEWMGHVSINSNKNILSPKISLLNAWLPYVFLAVLLVSSRLSYLGLGDRLKALKFQWDNLLDTSISTSTTPLYLPGTFLIIAGILVIVLHKMTLSGVRGAVSESLKITISAGFVLLFTVPMVRIYINSGLNESGLESMPILMAGWVAGAVENIYPIFASTIGALGAFIAGSNTVSNLMFSLFQFGVAQNLGIPTHLLVSLGAVGAAAGNMIAIHNVVAACAAVGYFGKEGNILRLTLLPTLYYLMAVGFIGWLLTTVFVPTIPY